MTAKAEKQELCTSDHGTRYRAVTYGCLIATWGPETSVFRRLQCINA